MVVWKKYSPKNFSKTIEDKKLDVFDWISRIIFSLTPFYFLTEFSSVFEQKAENWTKLSFSYDFRIFVASRHEENKIFLNQFFSDFLWFP